MASSDKPPSFGGFKFFLTLGWIRLESKFCCRNEFVSPISCSSKNVLPLWFNGSKAASFCVSDQVINRRTLQMSLNSVLYLCRNPCYHPSPSAVFPVFPAITLLPVFPVFPQFLEFPTITLSLCVPVVPVVPAITPSVPLHAASYVSLKFSGLEFHKIFILRLPLISPGAVDEWKWMTISAG